MEGVWARGSSLRLLPCGGEVPGGAYNAKRPLDLLVFSEATLTLTTMAVGSLMSVFLVVSAVEAQQAFFAAVSDLPLMPGLVETADVALVFDNPAGRIVE